MTNLPKIAAVEERDAFPPGTVAHWTIQDHQGVFDHLPAKYLPYMPEEFDLHRVQDGWVADNEPLMVLTGDQLPPLPWRLVSQPPVDDIDNQGHWFSAGIERENQK